jgi:hypothetical protein
MAENRGPSHGSSGVCPVVLAAGARRLRQALAVLDVLDVLDVRHPVLFRDV